MVTRPRNRFRWGTAIAGALLLFGSATMVWGFATYLHLLRLRVEVTDACSWVEAASRSRVELVSGLIRSAGAFACLDTARLAELRGTTERAVPGILLGHILEDPQPYRDFRRNQAELSMELSEIWSAMDTDSRAGALVILEDFPSRLERSDALLADGFAGLDRCIERYRVATASFSGSTVARITGLGSPRSRS